MQAHRHQILQLVGGLIAGALLGVALRLIAFLLAILVLRGAATLALGALDAQPWLDPVYTRAALHTLTDVRLRGVAIGGPLGEALHQRGPSVLLDPAAAHGGLARLVVAPGRAVLGRLLAAGLAHAAVLAVGLLVVRVGWRQRRTDWLLLGIATQAQVAVGILTAPPSLSDLEATGISFAANALLPWLAPRSAALSDPLAGFGGPLLSGVLVAVALLAAYAPAVALVAVARAAARRLRVPLVSGVHVARARAGSVAPLLSALLIVVGSAAAACAGAWVVDTRASAPPAEARVAAAEPELTAPAPSAPAAATGLFGSEWDSWFREMAATGPSQVEIVGQAYDFQYLVNGRPETIRGMGLNTQYASELSPDERRARLNEDFSAMRALGINTLVGWDPQEFDGLLLDRAAAHGLGVVLPFDLDPAIDYTDAATRADLTQQVLDWVQRNRDAPALRMWGLGNEVLHKIVHPAWVGPEDPAAARNARAFAAWLVATADAIHAADPAHPVTYRSAEDAFAPWVLDALRQGGGPRPWFVWGTNCYQDYLSTIVDEWPAVGMGSPLWVSEFAPGGMAVPDRPDGFRTMWGYVRRHPEWVLGGAVYAWTRNGPEGVDRTFGLTDDGTPVDGRSLDALGELFDASP